MPDKKNSKKKAPASHPQKLYLTPERQSLYDSHKKVLDQLLNRKDYINAELDRRIKAIRDEIGAVAEQISLARAQGKQAAVQRLQARLGDLNDKMDYWRANHKREMDRVDADIKEVRAKMNRATRGG